MPPDAAMNTTFDRLLNVDDLAERLGTTPNSVRIMRARGQLPKAVKQGKRVRWLESEFTEWLRNLPRT